MAQVLTVSSEEVPPDTLRLTLEPPVAHALRVYVHAQSGREVMECSGCGFFAQTFGIRRDACPIGEAEADYTATLDVAVRRRESEIAAWRQFSAWHQRDLLASA